MIRSTIISSFILMLCHSVGAQVYFPVPVIGDPERFTTGITRTMNLLQTSTRQNSNEVRIMVYGQSISQQDWWKEVKQHLDSSYPEARIIFINKAIGGFSAERLIHTVDNDVVSFYPDLILFHDYGNEEQYEKIIQVIRSRTTSEIAIQTDHMAMQNQDWHDKHSSQWLPMLAKKYDLALIDIRATWKKYLEENELDIKDLLKDGVHLNDHGNYLMASLIKNYFNSAGQAQSPNLHVTYLQAGNDFQMKNKRIELPIHGNRVDLIWKKNVYTRNKLTIRVDEKNPTTIKECYYYTRPATDTAGFFLRRIGQPLAITLQNQPIEEEWKMTITWSDSIEQEVGFRVEGSVSGEDGVGRSDSLFTSVSGRILIHPASWFRAKEFAGFPWLKPGDVLKWRVKRTCASEVAADTSGATTILQGIENRPHALSLSGKGLRNLSGIRIYRPPLNFTPALHKKEY